MDSSSEITLSPQKREGRVSFEQIDIKKIKNRINKTHAIVELKFDREVGPFLEVERRAANRCHECQHLPPSEGGVANFTENLWSINGLRTGKLWVFVQLKFGCSIIKTKLFPLLLISFLATRLVICLSEWREEVRLVGQIKWKYAWGEKNGHVLMNKGERILEGFLLQIYCLHLMTVGMQNCTNAWDFCFPSTNCAG